MMKPTNGPHPTIRSVSERMRIIDPTAAISAMAVVGATGEWRDRPTRFPVHVGARAIIREFAVVHAGCERPTIIDEDVLICSHAYVGHDTRVHHGVEILPGARICGLVEIHKGASIGASATILPRVTIGAGARIGAGAVVRRDVPAGETWVGVPARRVR